MHRKVACLTHSLVGVEGVNSASYIMSARPVREDCGIHGPAVTRVSIMNCLLCARGGCGLAWGDEECKRLVPTVAAVPHFPCLMVPQCG